MKKSVVILLLVVAMPLCAMRRDDKGFKRGHRRQPSESYTAAQWAKITQFFGESKGVLLAGGAIATTTAVVAASGSHIKKKHAKGEPSIFDRAWNWVRARRIIGRKKQQS